MAGAHGYFYRERLRSRLRGNFAEQGVYQAMLDVRDGSVLLTRPLQTTAQGYQRRMFGKLLIGTPRPGRRVRRAA